MLYNIIPPVGLLLFTYKSIYSLTGKFNQPGYFGVRPRSNSYLTIYHLQPIFFIFLLIKQRALARTRVSLNSKALLCKLLFSAAA